MSEEVPPIEEDTLVEAIHRISLASEVLMSSGLNRKAVMVLIKHHSGVSMRDIKRVLDSLSELKDTYCGNK